MPKCKRGTPFEYPLDEIPNDYKGGGEIDGLMSHELSGVCGGLDGAADTSSAPGYNLLRITGDCQRGSRHERSRGEPEKDDCGNDSA